ncbi:hypothetical protein D3C81_1801630 [compost metagenome]
MHATAGAEDHCAHAFDQTYRMGFGIPEGNAGTSYQIEPVLQLRRHVQVVHGRTDQQHIACLEFGDQLIGQGHHALGTFAQILGAPQCLE